MFVSLYLTRFFCFKEAYYKDFFEPPRGQRKGVKKASKNTPKPKNTQVRFHDEVKVKIIKNKGKGLPVSAMNIVPSLNDDDEDEDDDEEDELTLSDNGSQDESSSKDEDEEENEEGDDEEGDGDEGREAIDRLKDDLFADDDEEEDRSREDTLRWLRPHILTDCDVQNSPRMKSECPHSENKLLHWKRRMLRRRIGCLRAK